MKVSVIMPTLNSQETIDLPLRALEAQTFKDFELLIIDGGSLDQTIDRVRNSKLEAVRFVKQESSGIWGAINEGILAANGEILLVLNSDDFISPQVLAAVVENAEACEWDALWICSYSSAGFLDKLRINEIIWGMHKLSPGHSACFFVKREVHKSIGLYDEDISFCSDHEFFHRLIKQKCNIRMLEGVRNVFGVFTHGGYSSLNPYKEKIAEEYKFRSKSDLFADVIYCRFVFPLKLFWAFFKNTRN